MPYHLTNFHPGKGQTPEHIGLIPDGIRRWANRNNVPLLEAYLQAMHKIAQYISLFFGEGSQAVSIYLSSIQNFKRSEREVSAIFQAETMLCSELLPDVAKRFATRVSVAGRRDLLPSYFQDALNKIEILTSSQLSSRLYLCVAYNPLEEVAQAIRLADCSERFLQYLWVPEPLDLVIRTSGANLLSNFLPLQAGYARIYILNKLFNDTELADFQKILTEFKGLVRLYGD